MRWVVVVLCFAACGNAPISAPGSAPVRKDGTPVLPEWVVRPAPEDAGPPSHQTCKIQLVEAGPDPVTATAEASPGEEQISRETGDSKCARRDGVERTACYKARRLACSKLPEGEECGWWEESDIQIHWRTAPLKGFRVTVTLNKSHGLEHYFGFGRGASEADACAAAAQDACRNAGRDPECVAAGKFRRKDVWYPHEDRKFAGARLLLVCPPDRQLIEDPFQPAEAASARGGLDVRGSLKSHCALPDGTRDGPALTRSYEDQSMPHEFGEYRRGREHGVWQSFKDGKLHAFSVYRDGVPHGVTVGYWPNGRASTMGQHVNGEKEGLWLTWAEDGRPAGRASYLKGRKVYFHGQGPFGQKNWDWD